MTLTSGEPAGPDRPLVERPRLLAALAERFTKQLTIVVGGGGAGKTTLLQQAISAEASNEDIVHNCSPADRDQERLLDGLLTAATGVDADERVNEPNVAAVVEALVARSPGQVCLILDDTHHLDDFSVIGELVSQLPRNGHVLLAGRRRPELDTARLDAAGQFSEIDQASLLMTDEECIEFANLRGIDVELLERTDGWPAFVELAASGSEIRSLRYLQEEALSQLAPERRRGLAAFAFVGGGDDQISTELAGLSVAELVADLPLVRMEHGRARLHDLWGEALTGELSAEDRRSIATNASAILRGQRWFDQAIDLCQQAEDWHGLLTGIGAAVRDGVDGGLRIDRLKRWRRLIPKHHLDDPVVALIDGLIEREIDPTKPLTFERLQTAAEGFRAAENNELELVALLQLGYISRIGGDASRLAPIISRTAELAEHYPPAKPFLAFGDAWTALADGRPDLQLEAMQSLDGQDLPPVWQVTRDHLYAHSLLNLGRPQDALDHVPKLIETLPVPIPGALVTESQCLWHAGQPERAMSRKPSGEDPRYGARDRLIAGLWNAMMYAISGDVAEAKRSLDVALASHGEQPSTLVTAQVYAVTILIKLAEGHIDEAKGDMDGILDALPLGEGISDQLLRNHLLTIYVLCEKSRDYWDRTSFGPSIDSLRETAAAFVAAREDDDKRALSTLKWPEPGLIGAHLPTHWSVELGLRGVAADVDGGRRLIRWLCEHWGEPARAALRSWIDDEQLGRAAKEMLSHIPSPPPHRTSVRVLGTTEVHIDGVAVDNPEIRRERSRALLALLVMRRTTTRDGLAGTLWPDLAADRATKNLRTTLGYAHHLLEPHRVAGDAPWFLRLEGHQVRVLEDLDVDLWQFTDLIDRAEAEERAGHPTAALPLLLEACGLWRGDLAADLDAEFLELDRIHLRSRYVRAACRAAELLVATDRPAEAIEVARLGLATDRWSERGYRTLAAAYLATGDRTAANAVLSQAAQTIGELTDR